MHTVVLGGGGTIYCGLRTILLVVDWFNIAVPLVVIVQHDQYSHNVQDQPRDYDVEHMLLLVRRERFDLMFTRSKPHAFCGLLLSKLMSLPKWALLLGDTELRVN